MQILSTNIQYIFEILLRISNITSLNRTYILTEYIEIIISYINETSRFLIEYKALLPTSFNNSTRRPIY